MLAEHYTILTLEEHTKQESLDGTVKFLFKLVDGNLIETVLMRHKFGLSVCVTTRSVATLVAASAPAVC